MPVLRVAWTRMHWIDVLDFTGTEKLSNKPGRK